MFKLYSFCRMLLPVLLFFGNTAYADTSKANRSNFVRVATYAAPSSQAAGVSANPVSNNIMGSTKIYAADILNADWKNQSGSFACILSHHIEGFGNAVFSRKTGSGEMFYLTPQGSVVFPQGIASIDTLPPAWRSDVMPIPLGKTMAVAGDQPVKLAPANFAPLLTQLTADTKVMFTASSGRMRVVLDPKNFSAAYKSYQQCLGVLVPYTFAQVSHLSLNYPEKAEGLSEANKSELNKVARYVKADPKVLGILVDAHSDNKGTADENDFISKQESEWVSAYLVLQGIDAEKITARWHGDKFPVGNNKTDAGRAQNRRVTVRLENEETRREIEQKATLRLAAEQREKEKKEKEQQAKQIAENEQKQQDISDTESSEKPLAKDQSTQSHHLAADEQSSIHASLKDVMNERDAISSKTKVTPEQISKMVDGLDLIPKQ